MIDETSIVRQGSSSNIQFVYPPVTGKPGTLALTSNRWTIKSNLETTPFTHIRFEGRAVLLVGNENVPDVTVTMKGTFEAPLDQIFELHDGGKINLSTREIPEVYPQWWGATGNGNDDDTTAIQAALDAADANLNSSHYRRVVLPENTYLVTSTLRIRCDLRGQTNPFQASAATIKYTGTEACLKNNAPYQVGMRISNILIDLTQSDVTNPVYGILCFDGHVAAHFDQIKILCNGNPSDNPPSSQFPRYGIYLCGKSNCVNNTLNIFTNVIIYFPKIGIQVGDDTLNCLNLTPPPLMIKTGIGSNTIISGGEILGAKEAAIIFTGGQNTIIGGDHSAQSGGTVILFDGEFCQNNSIISTELDVMDAIPSDYAIKIVNNPSVSQVFMATSIRVVNGSFVNDLAVSDNKQRWVGIRGDAAVEARLLFVRGIDHLSSTGGQPGPFDGSIIGGGGAVDRALLFKASSLSGASGILLGTSSAPSPDQLTFPTDLPVATNSVALMAGPDGRIYFVQSISDDLYPPGTHADQLGNIDALGNLSLRGGLQFGGGKFWKSADTKPGNDVSGVVGEIRWNNTPILGDEAPNYRGYAGWIKMPDEVWHPFGKIE